MSNTTEDGIKTSTPAPEGKKKKLKEPISSYTILLIITIITGVVTWFVAPINHDITAVHLSDIVMSPVLGVLDGIEVSLFLLIFGGCMGIVNKVGAIDAGIRLLIKKLKGHELVLVPIVMALFALLGSTYGFCEETIPFYGLLGATMFMAGYDTIVSSATVLFGAGVGCLGSTVNPFANGVAIATLEDMGIHCNTAITIGLGVLLTVVSYLIALYFILSYAKKVKADKGSTILSLQEQQECEAEYGAKAAQLAKESDNASLTFVQKLTLVLFGLTFVVMIIGFIPWEDFGFNAFVAGQETETATETVTGSDIAAAWSDNSIGGDLAIDESVEATVESENVTNQAWSAKLIGMPIGEWYFNEASAWFFFMAVVIAFAARLSEAETVDAFISGAGDMVGVALVVGLARALNILLEMSGLDVVILESASEALQGLSAWIFAPLSYVVYLGLSVIITSTSALASVSMPIMGPLAQALNFAPEVMVMIFVAANGLANLFSPTAIFLPGLMLARVKYSTYLKWCVKPVVCIAIASLIILTVAMMLL